MTAEYKVVNTVADNVLQLEISAIKKMAMLSARVDDAVSLAWGLPSFSTPDYIRDAVKQQLDIDDDLGKYSLPDGLAGFRQQVAQKHLADTGVQVSADDNVMITAGNMQGMNILFHSILNEGDEVILTDPCFASHIQQLRLCGALPVYWPLDEDNDWQPNSELLAARITDKTRAIVIVSPSNPTGIIFSKQVLMKLGELARERGLLVIIDDPYSAFIYENSPPYFNLAAVPEFSGNIVYLFSFSKCYAMSGWRLGYMIMPAYLKQQVLKVQDANIICAPRISQIAGMAALAHAPDHLAGFIKILSARRALICERLDQLPHVFSYSRPEAAYYVFPRILVPHDNSHDFSIKLLESVGVSLTPGSAFGPSGEHHVRMAYCVDDGVINEAFDRIEKYFSSSYL
ncbi:MAG: pyridoxal phosphate-dependent aminotransferase [Gammaproteobacteria bacterium]|nr:pyridoxal phosphate-dependent aminotransferase [Gammaproteobacteria bacterium]